MSGHREHPELTSEEYYEQSISGAMGAGPGFTSVAGANGPAGPASVMSNPVFQVNLTHQYAEVRQYLERQLNGCVLSWEQAPSPKLGSPIFTYAAVKAKDSWYTTATDANTTVQQVVDDASLAVVLCRPETVLLRTMVTGQVLHQRTP